MSGNELITNRTAGVREFLDDLPALESFVNMRFLEVKE